MYHLAWKMHIKDSKFSLALLEKIQVHRYMVCLQSLPKNLLKAQLHKLVQNYSECRICGSSCGDLLCCETCPNVYHLSCTDPPLELLPRGKWTCPECEEIGELQDIEKILSSHQARAQLSH